MRVYVKELEYFLMNFFSYTPSHRLPENIYGSLLSNGLNSERVCDKKG